MDTVSKSPFDPILAEAPTRSQNVLLPWSPLQEFHSLWKFHKGGVEFHGAPKKHRKLAILAIYKFTFLDSTASVFMISNTTSTIAAIVHMTEEPAGVFIDALNALLPAERLTEFARESVVQAA